MSNTIARVRAVLAEMDAEANDYSARYPDTYDQGADDQLDTDRRRLREALDNTAPTDPERHGEYAGYQQHRKRGEKPCDACRDARNAWERGRRAARATAEERARLTSDEIADLYAAAEARDTATYVECLIARRLLRYTS